MDEDSGEARKGFTLGMVASRTNLRHRFPESLTAAASEAQQDTENASVFYYSKVKLEDVSHRCQRDSTSRQNVTPQRHGVTFIPHSAQPARRQQRSEE
jgi:hypothetical protein